MSKTLELVTVVATFYMPGIRVAASLLMECENDLWWFEDPDCETVRDCLDDPAVAGRQLALFVSPALHFSLHPYHQQDSIALRLDEGATAADLFASDLSTLVQLAHALCAGRQRVVEFMVAYEAAFCKALDEYGKVEGYDLELTLLGRLDWSRLRELVQPVEVTA